MIFALYIMGLTYILAGFNHFRAPKIYIKMMPPAFPAHKLLVILSGIAEIVLGVGLLFEPVRPWAAWGIILLLVAIFPANIYMLTSGKFTKIPKWILWVRLPLQFLLIYWAYLYT